MLLLDRAGFKHIVKDRSKKDEPFDPTSPDQSQKLWYSRPGAVSVCREYLQALLKGDQVVPHWQPTGFYACLLDGTVYHPAASRKQLKLQDWDAEDMDAGAMPSKPSKPSKGHAKRRQMQLEDAAPTAAALSGSDEEAFPPAVLDLPGQAVQDTTQPTTDAPPKPELEAAPVCEADANLENSARASSSNESTDSSSDSSSSSSSSSSAGDRSSMNVAGSDPESDEARAPRKRGAHKAESWGAFRFIYFNKKGGGTGYQLTCTNPQHQSSGAAACTKSRSDKFAGGKDMCLRMLKQWALAGASVSSKAEHQAQWESVLRAHASSSVRTMDDLDANVVRSWSDHAAASSARASAPSQPQAAPKKKRRTNR